MLIELELLEVYQLQAALEDRLTKAVKQQPRMTPGSLEASMVDDEITYTGSALTKLQTALYGDDEPDEPVWDLMAERAAHDGHETMADGCSLCLVEFNISARYCYDFDFDRAVEG
jgi:hypothetical protein